MTPEWTRTFAWRPRRTVDAGWVWLVFVSRIDAGGAWVYRRAPDAPGGLSA